MIPDRDVHLVATYLRTYAAKQNWPRLDECADVVYALAKERDDLLTALTQAVAEIEKVPYQSEPWGWGIAYHLGCVEDAAEMSKGALKNPDRRRELHEIEIPAHVVPMLEPGSRAFKMAGCNIIVSQQKAGWHLSISRKDRLPTWEEVRDARYALVPDEATMALLLPPQSEYVNAHEFCLQMYEIPGEYIEKHQDRL